MKKSIYVLFVLFVLSTPAYSLAQDTTATPSVKKGLWGEISDKVRETREEIRENKKEALTTIKEDRKEMQEDLKAVRLTGTPGAERKATISATRFRFRKDRLTAVYNSIKTNLANRFNLLDATIKPKVQAKIDAQTAAGKDTAEAKAKMSAYTTSSYTSNLATLEAKFQAILTSSEPKNMLGELNSATKAVRTDLNTMRQTLLDAFRLAIRAPAKS